MQLTRADVRLPPEEWVPRSERHRERAETWTLPHLRRRDAGIRHPVEDFLFDYYSYEPGKLARWHPGAGRLLLGVEASDYLRLGSYRRYGDAVGADLARLARRAEGLRWTRDLLALTRVRAARTDCFGMHEWAMVYRAGHDELRHASFPLRLGSSGTDEVVESHPLRCSHYDAYRFFTSPARPRNEIELSREVQQRHEQPGCLHANMDLYRAAYKLAPFVEAGLVLDAFELARDIRELDMRASPYDLTSLGYAPVRIEEPAGKAEYVRAQRAFAERAAPLRDRLVDELDRLLSLLPHADG